MHTLTYGTLFLLIAFNSSYAFTFPKSGPQSRQNIPIEYAEPWDSTNERADGDFAEEGDVELPCECMPVTQCGASMRNGDTEENLCPIDGDVCCILKKTGDSGEGDAIRDLAPVQGGSSVAKPQEIPQHCHCVPITECGATFRVDEDEDEESSEENVCANPGEVCCESPPEDPGQRGKTESPLPAPDSGYGGTGLVDQPQTVDEISPLGCGQAQTFPTVFASMDVTEQNAKFGELPWTVLIYENKPSEENNGIGDYKCAGSLIHPKLIITAAHCVDKQDLFSLTVRAGDWDIFQTRQEPIPYQESFIESSILHPNFISGRPPFDLAVVVLTEPFNLTRNVNVICLPNYTLDEVDTNDCVSAGWGKTPSGQESSVLKKIIMPVVERKKCQEALRTTRLGKYFKLHKSYLCAGGRADQDVCQGDGGGPLSCKAKTDGAMVLVGVTSWGVGCGKEGIPGVFADVLFLNSWLNDILLRIVQD